MLDEDLGTLFMKIDADGSGGVDWDELTSFLLQARKHKMLYLELSKNNDNGGDGSGRAFKL